MQDQRRAQKKDPKRKMRGILTGIFGNIIFFLSLPT